VDGAPQQNTPETCPLKQSGRVRDAEVRCMPDELLHLPVIQRILARDKDTPGALLPILHAVQHEIGYIPDASVPEIAHALNLSLAEVRGVISFYHDFRTAPPARHTLRLCRAESCQSRGAEALAAQLREQLALDDHGTSADGSISLRPVYCLGACACSPALELDGQVHARLTPERLRDLVNGCREDSAC
jgi:formate dehydrogenase subunit gamma